MSVIDAATGTFTEGRFKGMSPEDVAAYAETMEEVVKGNKTPEEVKPPAGAPPKELTPEEKLAAANAERTGGMNQSLIVRLVEEDEERARAAISDYDKYKEEIHKVRATLTPQQLITRGVHEQMYINIKGRSPEGRAALFGTQQTAAPPIADGEEEPGEEKPPTPPPPATPPKGATPKAVGPKAAAPTLAPTPGERQAEPPKKSKLKPNDKIRRFCQAQGMDVNEYLLRLEAQGRTQDDINALERREDPNARPASIYGRPIKAR